jgi:DNA-binding NarL/FixJ family response regulator
MMEGTGSTASWASGTGPGEAAQRMYVEPVDDPASVRSPESEFLRTMAEDVAAGRRRLEVTSDEGGLHIELRLTEASPAALEGLRHVRLPETEKAIRASLSPRERAMLRLVADGLTNRQIAGELHLAEKTVRNRLSLVFAKLGIERRSQAAAFAVRNGLADTGS